MVLQKVISGAVELAQDEHPRRIRMKHIPQCHGRVFDTKPSSKAGISPRTAGSDTRHVP